MTKDQEDFYFGKHEVELTDKLITKLVKEKKWSNVESLKEMREKGGKWNTKRDSVVFPTELLE